MAADEALGKTSLARGAHHRLFKRTRWVIALFAPAALIGELLRPTHSTWIDIVLYLALPAMWVVFALCFAWPPRALAERTAGGLLVRHPWGMRYGIRALLILGGAGFVALTLSGSSARDEPIAAAIVLVFAAALVGLAIFVPRQSFRITGDGLELRSRWTGRASHLRWADVTSARQGFGFVADLRTPNTRMKIALGLDGSAELAAHALSGIATPVLDADRRLRALLEAVASRLSWSADEGAGQQRTSPSTLIAASVLLLAGGVAVWSASARFETELRLAIPPGWTDLTSTIAERSAGALPPILYPLRPRQKRHIIALAAAKVGSNLDPIGNQTFWSDLYYEQLDADAVERLYVDSPSFSSALTRVLDHGIDRLGNARIVRAELAVLDRFELLVYAVPVGPRFAVLAFTCGAGECAHVRELARASVQSTQGIVEPGSAEQYAGPLVRSIALLGIFGAFFVLLAAAEKIVQARRRARARRTCASAGTEVDCA